jgi:hypothetical protein
MNQRLRDIDYLIDMIDMKWNTLTPWERTFIDSVHRRFMRVPRISRKQEKILKKIYSERVMWTDEDKELASLRASLFEDPHCV